MYEPIEASAITAYDARAALEIEFANVSYTIGSESQKSMQERHFVSHVSIVASTFPYRASNMPEKWKNSLHNFNPVFLKKYWMLRNAGLSSPEIYNNIGYLDQYASDKLGLTFMVGAAAAENDSVDQTGGAFLTYESYKIEDIELDSEISLNSSAYNDWGNPESLYQPFAEALGELNTSKSTMTRHYDVVARRDTLYSGFIQTQNQLEAILKNNIAANESNSATGIVDPDRVDDLSYDVDYAVLTQYVSQNFANYIRGAANNYLSSKASASVSFYIFGIKVFEIPKSMVPMAFLFPQPVYALDLLGMVRDAFGAFIQTAVTIASDTSNLLTGALGMPTPDDWGSVGQDYYDRYGAFGSTQNPTGGSILPVIGDDNDGGSFDPLGWIMAALKQLQETFLDFGGRTLNMVGGISRNITTTLLDTGGNIVAGPFLSIIGGIRSFVSTLIWVAIIGCILILALAWVIYRRRSKKPIIPFT
ncbi:MAG: hypothetical protein ACFFCI_02200 [Promethearchaeota archaeon]